MSVISSTWNVGIEFVGVEAREPVEKLAPTGRVGREPPGADQPVQEGQAIVVNLLVVLGFLNIFHFWQIYNYNSMDESILRDFRISFEACSHKS